MSSYGGPSCERRDCPCTHEPPCDRGWIDLVPMRRNGQFYNRAQPCPTCRPDASDRYYDVLQRESTDDGNPFVKPPPSPPAARRHAGPVTGLPPWFRDAVAASTAAAETVRARYAPGQAIPPEEMEAATAAAVDAVKERYI